jgi:hypothetical protein
LDLLRVISHHRARLATPIRTVQKIYSEADLENIPFADTIFSRSRAAANRPFLLIEPPSYRVSSDDKNKTSARPTRNGENDVKVEAVSTPDPKADAEAGSESSLDPKMDHKAVTMSASDGSSNSKASAVQISDTKAWNLVSESSVQNKSEMMQLKNENRGDAWKETIDPNSKDVSMAEKALATSLEAGSEKMEISSATSQAKQDGGRAIASQSMLRPPLEENIVLGVALEGSKRTLPIEEELAPSPMLAESKELTACRNGSESPAVSKDKKDGQSPAFPSGQQSDNC